MTISTLVSSRVRKMGLPPLFAFLCKAALDWQAPAGSDRESQTNRGGFLLLAVPDQFD